MDISRTLSISLNRVLDVPIANPDDARRRRLLNIIVCGIALGALLLLIATGIVGSSRPVGPSGARNYIYMTGSTIFIVTILFYTLNRNQHIPSWIVSGAFMLFLLVAVAFSDTPLEVAQGRTLFAFTIPIVVSSVLLAPVSSFIFAALSSVVIGLIATSIGSPINTPAIVGFFMLALVSWLSSRSLEQALVDLRVTNANLDKLVAERTQALAEALTTQRAEAGQRQAILNSIADGVIVFDLAGKAILANPASQMLLDMPAKALLSSSFQSLAQSPGLSARDHSLLETVMATKAQPSSFRIQWGKKTLSVSAAQVYGATNDEIGTVAVFRDVTREAELERMKSSFVAMVSHELRTPLSAILGFTEMLKEGVYGPVSEKQAATVGRITRNAQHMLGMVGDLLDQAQIEAGKLRITEGAFKPAELLKSVQDVMGQTVKEKGLRLAGEVDPALPKTLIGDFQRLQQILMNLVTNAVKFTDEGEIGVRLYLRDPQHWGLEVRDSGRGIPKDEVDHIFDAFYQVDPATTREQHGFGLGLSIVKQLVQLMRGEIRVQSALGTGSIFTLILPLQDHEMERKRVMTHTALIVEDDADLATIFAEALHAAGFETQVIRDGALAQRRMSEIAPQIIILDLHLPHVDGSTLLTQIRADAVLKGTIVIVATADAVMGEIYRDVADIVLIKPISFVQLRDLSARLKTFQESSVSE